MHSSSKGIDEIGLGGVDDLDFVANADHCYGPMRYGAGQTDLFCSCWQVAWAREEGGHEVQRPIRIPRSTMVAVRPT